LNELPDVVVHKRHVGGVGLHLISVNAGEILQQLAGAKVQQ
jgi:hypothetical protein